MNLMGLNGKEGLVLMEGRWSVAIEEVSTYGREGVGTYGLVTS